MNSQEEILSYFKRKATDIIYKYSIKASSPSYGNQHLRMSSYFGEFNENMIMLEKDLDTETANIISNYVNEDMDIPNIIDGLCAYSYNARLQYITLSHP
ncbi:MAG TPA: hypothetical protein VF622_15370 [Segetibacter sp.]|jgi:hypothetical protein